MTQVMPRLATGLLDEPDVLDLHAAVDGTLQVISMPVRNPTRKWNYLGQCAKDLILEFVHLLFRE